jgi:hypothetical protein
MPGGEPVGEPGRSRVGGVRVVQGSLETAQEFFDKFRELGEPVNEARFSGELLALGDEGRVGLRRRSKSGEPTITVGLECVPEIRKIKFV